MSTVQNYTLTSRSETGPLVRAWTALVRSMLPALILLGDVAIIVSMSCFTGIGYHLVVYNEIGDILTFLNVGAGGDGFRRSEHVAQRVPPIELLIVEPTF